MLSTIKTLIRILLPFIIGSLLFFAFFLSQPIGQYCFRHWEALTARGDNVFLPGPDYPSIFRERVEVGDLAPYTKNAVAKKTSWRTDAYGYRQHESTCTDPVAVVTGDSFVIGSGLDSNQMLGAQYEKLSGQCTLSLGGGNFPEAIANIKLRNIHPRFIYLAKVEKYIHENWQEDQIEKIRGGRALRYELGLQPSNASSWTGIELDRASSLDYFQFRKSKGVAAALARLSKDLVNVEQLTDDVENPFADKKMLFREGESAFVSYTPKDLLRITAILTQYQQMAKAIGAEFVFIGIPNKESVYPEQIPSQQQSHFLEELQQVLTDNRIQSLDLFEAYRIFKAQNPSTLLYQTDDTHWSAQGVGLAAELMSKSANHAE